MDDTERRQVERNREIRGYIMRSLAKGFNYSLLQRQLVRIMTDEGVVLSPDISAYLEYLVEGGYIKFTNERVKAHSAYRDDAVIKLTKAGIDLIEGSINDDPGIEI
jgi:hypothetical protein